MITFFFSDKVINKVIPNSRSTIRRVVYKRKEEIEAEMAAASPYHLDALPEPVKESFFTKRSEFLHEKEIRYVFVTYHYHKAKTIEMRFLLISALR